MNALDDRQTARLRLVKIGPDDLEDLVRMYADPQVMATLGGVRTREWVGCYLNDQIAHWQRHGFGFWTMRDLKSGQFIGRGGLRHQTIDGRLDIEVGYGLMADFWGRSLATELARESVRVGFAELNLPELVSFTLPTNVASRRVMEKVGFRYERDILWADLPHILYRQRKGDFPPTS